MPVRATTDRLKAELWRRFGSAAYPAEWDGKYYGGGRLSQRFWEYLKAIELLDLDRRSVVLDIGGGSPLTGVGFFSSLLAEEVERVITMDPSIAPDAVAPQNVQLNRSAAGYDELRAVLAAHPQITHVVSVSVFEHVEPKVRLGMVRAINAFLPAGSFVATFEYHARTRYFEHALTARTTSELFAPFTNFYLDELSASPVWCENAFDRTRVLRFLKPRRFFAASDVPQWYPVAVRFVRMRVAPCR
jgi:cyclopropane fatty-acyl-phospholipid synthase-like methyltransferase